MMFIQFFALFLCLVNFIENSNGTPTAQCTLKDGKLKCGTATCQVTMGTPKIPVGKYRIGKKQTETAEGLPSSPFYYVYKSINNDPSKGFWTELTYIPEMRCTKEYVQGLHLKNFEMDIFRTPWMNSDRLAVANSFGFQNQQCFDSSVKAYLDGLPSKRFDTKVCPSTSACQNGQCANLASLGALPREYIAELIVE